jgi:hypothetical protein
MKAVQFPQQTVILAENQPEYIPLPVYIKYEKCKVKNDQGVEEVVNVPWEATACFELSPAEIGQVIAGGKLWFTQCIWGQRFQPINMSMINPFAEHDLSRPGYPKVAYWPEEIAETIRSAARYIAKSQGDPTDAAESLLVYLQAKLQPKAATKHADMPEGLTHLIQSALLKAYQAGERGDRQYTISVYHEIKNEILKLVKNGE